MTEQTECPICYENLCTTNVCITSCNHKFHTNCLIRCKCCPLCRTSFEDNFRTPSSPITQSTSRTPSRPLNYKKYNKIYFTYKN